MTANTVGCEERPIYPVKGNRRFTNLNTKGLLIFQVAGLRHAYPLGLQLLDIGTHTTPYKG